MDMMLVISLLFYAPVVIIIGCAVAMMIISIIDLREQYKRPSIEMSAFKKRKIKPEKLVFYAHYNDRDHYVTESELKRIRTLYPLQGE